MEEEDQELQNPFPSPPSHYNNYTANNLRLLALLRERVSDDDISQADQPEVLSDQQDVPEWPLIQLEKPRVDWILEEGGYAVFGEPWQVNEKIPSLKELLRTQLYPEDITADRRPALTKILKSILVSYSALTSSLLAPPVPPDFPADENWRPEWQRHIDWINWMAQNIMAAANDLRPVQARVNVELMMKRQLEIRKEETAAIHSKCDELERRLSELRIAVQSPADLDINGRAIIPATDETTRSLSLDDVLRWAEEIG